MRRPLRAEAHAEHRFNLFNTGHPALHRHLHHPILIQEPDTMSRFARKERPPPGFEVLEPTLNALEADLRESESTPYGESSMISLVVPGTSIPPMCREHARMYSRLPGRLQSTAWDGYGGHLVSLPYGSVEEARLFIGSSVCNRGLSACHNLYSSSIPGIKHS